MFGWKNISAAATTRNGNDNRSTKHQAPSSREAPTFKPKFPCGDAAPATWDLLLGASLELGAWCLVLFITMSFHPPEDLRRIYEARFRKTAAMRRAVWRVLIEDFFHPLVRQGHPVTVLG